MQILAIFIPITTILLAKYIVLKHDYRQLTADYDRIRSIQQNAKLSENEEWTYEKE